MIAGAEEREGEGGWLPMGLSEDGCQGLRVLSFSFFSGCEGAHRNMHLYFIMIYTLFF